MAELHREPNYMGVWWWLLGFTIAEIVVAVVIDAALVKGILLVGMALSKAAMIALYFMHLKFERITLGVIVCTPLIICVWLILMMLPDLGAIEHKSEVRTEQAGSGH